MKKYVIDSSIILSVGIEKNPKTTVLYSDLIRKIEKKKVKLYAPVLLKYEVANGLRFSALSKEELYKFWDCFSDAPIIYFDVDKSFFSTVARLAKKMDTTLYDTIFHYIAMVIDGTFLTRDKKYYQKARILGNIELI